MVVIVNDGLGVDILFIISIIMLEVNWINLFDINFGIFCYWYVIGIIFGGNEFLDWMDNVWNIVIQ